MPEPLPVAVLDDDVLEDAYDPGSLTRGEGYADDGRVQIMRSEPGRIDAVCRGSGQSSYVVRVRWEVRGGEVRINDACTCPLEESCKHCVASILVARRQAAFRPQPRPPEVGSWRVALADLATGTDEADDDGVPSTAAIALQVALQQPRRGPYAFNTEPRLTIRPLRRGRSGKWVKTGATWREVAGAYASHGQEVDPRHRAALRALVTSGRGDLSYASSEDVPVGQFGPDFWTHLERAVDVGVVLVGERADDTVELSAVPAEAAVDLTADADGNVTIDVSIVMDGRPVGIDDEPAGLLGDPPHGLWTQDGSRLVLVPFDVPLHRTLARLASGGPLTVPADDVDELLDVYQPALARHATTGSSDGSVVITTNEFDGLTLVIERTALDAASLRWYARYLRGERETRHRLMQPAGEGRDRAAEAAAVDDLKLPVDLLPTLVRPQGGPRDTTFTKADAVCLLGEVVPWLEENTDVTVEVVGDLPALREATEAPTVSLSIVDGDEREGSGTDWFDLSVEVSVDGDEREGSGTDWFDLSVEVSVDGEVVDFTSLFVSLNLGEEVLILPSGTWLRLDRPELVRLRDLIDEANGLAEPVGDATARVNRFQVDWWDELAGLGVVAEQSAAWAEGVGRLGALTAPEPVPVPAGLDATLRHYQQEGLDWLAFLHRHGLGGILADDMGLGKTVQTLALCLHILESKPDARFLVVAPTSVVENWHREADRFAPGLDVATIRETEKRRGCSLAEAIGDARLVVTSYALFRIEHDDYAAQEWELLLLDEAQFVKNHTAKTYQCARRTPAATKIAITGTPLENTLMDLWALLSITAPGLYPDPKRFDATYRKPIEKGEAPELLATLQRRTAPLMRRRTKGEVLTELPPKIEQTVEIELSPKHARIYETQLQRERQKVLGLVGDVQKHRFEILRSLTVLRQLALDPALVDEDHDDVGSAKLDRLLDDLTQVVAEGHRALVFSQFTRFLGRLRTRLDEAGIDHAYLDGRTRRREDAIAQFKDGDAPVFVISLKAGGFGLNLTEADYCFVLDPWWNPATETQAVDRAHRIGQTNPVIVYRYVSEGTIEEKVMQLKAKKAALFDSVMSTDDGALSGALSEGDIRGLLGLG